MAAFLGLIGFYAIPTGSMEPTIPRGSLILVASVEPHEVKVGDIALVIDRALGVLIAHRVVAKDTLNGVIYVKGDAVNTITKVALDDVIGIVIFHVPYLGYLFLARELLIAAALLAIAVVIYTVFRL